MKIPVSGLAIGPVHKRDVVRASVQRERKRKEFAVILAFDVRVRMGGREGGEGGTEGDVGKRGGRGGVVEMECEGSVGEEMEVSRKGGVVRVVKA